MTDELAIAVYDGIGRLPHFDPGMVDVGVPQEVVRFRGMLAAANGILICTPEYAHGVPGSLKNAIDWTVASGEFSHKPTVLFTASTDGRYGHAALLEILRVIEAGNIDRQHLLIPFARTKITGEGRITDESVLQEVMEVMKEFVGTMNKK
jgi:NAD(P)H-dependent FMN reductase